MSKQHEPKVRDPLAHVAKGVSGYAGSLVMASLGGLFVAYIFNFHGLQTWLDAYFSGMDHSVKSHSGEVVRPFLKALPFLGFFLAGGVLYIVGNALTFFFTNKLKAAFKSKPSKAVEVAEAPIPAAAVAPVTLAVPAVVAVPAATHAAPVAPVPAVQAVALVAQPIKAKAKEPAVLIKPMRLPRREKGVTKVAPLTDQGLALR